ncbi:DUF499 domain-containing protein [Pyrococcus kukulkanii]|uniref:DUF499 domain-containing protein n=1 Tax=Pyrococcus kukulkanii TaxID=1609559 RepID=UPI00356AB593
MRYEVWDDVLDEGLDEYSAPELGDVITGNAPGIYTDPKEFFKRTYFTDPMLEILDQILRTFEGRERQNVYLIYSLFGGGKTHTILTIYHAFSNPNALLEGEVLRGYEPEKREKIREIAERISALSDTIILPIYGKGEMPRPRKPQDGVKTIWGYIAKKLGEFEKVKVEDETLTTPSPDLIREVVGRRKILFLIDEIVDYIDNLHKSTDEQERNYSKNVIKFFDHLATALLGSQSVMVMTLPMEEREGVVEVEKEYDRDIIIGVRRAVERVGGARKYSPLKAGGVSNELVEVLKRRIFKSINEEEKAKVLMELRDAYSNREVFGNTSSLEEALRKSYPFHPEYIEILRAIIERTGLQRTRDMIRITRIVIRGLLKENPALIMPHHINLHDDKIRGSFFSKSSIYGDYWTVFESDVNERKLREFSNPELAKIVLTYIFLKTYPYDSPTSLPEFPTPERIARGTYEPELFRRKGWMPVEIKDIVEEIKASVKFMYLNKKDPYLWFWRVANVSQMVESKVEELLETRTGEVMSELVRHVNKMVKERKSLVTSRGKKASIEDHVNFFKKNFIVVTREPQELQDTPEYKLLVLVRDDVDEDTLRRIIFMYGTGTRTYKNTIVVAFVARNGIEEMLKSMATVIACDEVKKDIREKFKQYGEDVVKIQMSMVEDIRRKALEDLESQIVQYFRMVAYPNGNGVRVVQAQASSKSVVENVYLALVSNGKVVDSLEDFEWLVDILRDVNINILRPEGYPISELQYVIMSNPKLPMIKPESLHEAIRDAVKALKIGIERDGEIFFKKVYDKPPETEEEGNPPASLKPRDIILPREVALNKQVSLLLGREKDIIVQKGDRDYRVRTWYEVYFPGSATGVPLRSLVENDRIKDEFFDEVLWGHIVEKREETPITKGDFYLEISEPLVKARPGEVVTIGVRVKPLGRDEFTVELSVNTGELDSYEVKLQNGETKEVTWTIIMPEKKTYAVIEGRSESKRREAEVTLIPVLEEETVDVSEIREEHKGYLLIAILDIDGTDILEFIPVKGKISGSMRIEKPLWEARFEEIDIEVAKYLLKEVEEVLGARAYLDATLRVEGEVKIDDLLFEKLRALNGKVTFRIKKGEKDE